MKKTELIMFAGILMVLSLTGCAPRVLTEVTMNYPARSVEEVKVYDVGDTVPNSAVAIGKVMVADGGFTRDCGYDRMLGLAKERTAENGGNGLLLSVHLEPSAWGSSCHQLKGVMFLMSDTIVDMTKPNAVMEGAKRDSVELAQLIKDRTIPSNYFRLNVGYGQITSDVETFKGVKHPAGLEVTLDYEHLWRSGLGIGVNTAMFHTSYSMADDGVDGNLSLYYIGPCFATAAKFHKHWGIGANIGLGYAYVDDVFIQQSGFGSMGKLRLEYMLDDKWGFGMDMSFLRCTFKKPEGVELKNNEKWGFSRIGYLLGVRYYF